MKLLLVPFLALVISPVVQSLERPRRTSGGWNRGSGFRPNYPNRPQIQPTAPPGHHYPLEPIWPVDIHGPQIQPTAPPGQHVPLYPDSPFNPHGPQIQPTAPPGQHYPLYPNNYPHRPQIQPNVPPGFLRPFRPDRPQIQPTFSPRPFKQHRPQIQPPLPSGHYPLDLGLSFRLEEPQIKTDFGTKSGDKSHLPEGSARTDRKGGQFTPNRR